MEFHYMDAAPLTTVGVNAEKQRAIIHHAFPIGIPKELVVSGFINQAQGFGIVRLTLPTNDTLAIAALILAHVPEIAPVDPDNPLNRTEVLLGEFVGSMTIALMTALSAEKRALTPTPEMFFFKQEEELQTIAIKIGFAGAWQLARAIEARSADALRVIAEHIVIEK